MQSEKAKGISTGASPEKYLLRDPKLLESAIQAHRAMLNDTADLSTDQVCLVLDAEKQFREDESGHCLINIE